MWRECDPGAGLQANTAAIKQCFLSAVCFYSSCQRSVLQIWQTRQTAGLHSFIYQPYLLGCLYTYEVVAPTLRTAQKTELSVQAACCH